MKKGVYFTNKKAAEPVKTSSGKTRKIFRQILIYAAITLGAGVIYVLVKSEGRDYLIAFLLAMFIMVSCVEVYLSNPDKESISILKRFLHRK